MLQCGNRHVTLRRIIILQKKIIRITSKVSLDSHNDVLFEEQEIFKFSDMYTKQVNLCIFLKEVYFLIIFVICLLLQAGYFRIIQEIPIFFILFLVELIFENSQFGPKGYQVLQLTSRETQNSARKYRFDWQNI